MNLINITIGIVGLYFIVNNTLGTIVGVIIGGVGYKFYLENKDKLKGTRIDHENKGLNGSGAPPYPKLHKPDSTTIHFPKNG